MMLPIAASLIRVLALGGAVWGGYLWLATHHYERGYAARVREVAAEIDNRNAALGEAERRRQIDLAISRAERDRAVLSAAAEMRDYCAANPVECGSADHAEPTPAPGPAASPQCQPTGLPAGVLQSLNRIR